MNKLITIIAICSFFLMGSAMAMDMDSMSHDQAKHDNQANMDKAAMDQPKMDSMDHSKMDHSASQEGGIFKKAVMVDGIHAEFQVMGLAAMNMTDPEGRTHHVMVSFMKNGEKMTNVVGKIKLIAPSGKEQVSDLKNFGNGIFASNFTIDEQGKWGVICLFKDLEGKHTAKFWYQHKMM